MGKSSQSAFGRPPPLSSMAAAAMNGRPSRGRRLLLAVLHPAVSPRRLPSCNCYVIFTRFDGAGDAASQQLAIFLTRFYGAAVPEMQQRSIIARFDRISVVLLGRSSRRSVICEPRPKAT